MEELRFLTVAQVIGIHDMELTQTGGEPGLGDQALLESAVGMPFAGFGDEYFHKDIFEMAAAYAYHLAKNHSFVDGNKRTGTLAALTFLDINGVTIEVDDDELASMIEQIVLGTVEKVELAAIFRAAAESPALRPDTDT